MKKGILTLLVMVLVFTVTGWAADNDNNANNNDERTKAEKRLDDAAAELNQLTSAPDNGIPQTILAKAQCVAIVPSMIKGGFIFGAEHGRGVATCRWTENGAHRHSLPSPAVAGERKSAAKAWTSRCCS